PRAAVPRHRDRREHAGALRGVRARVARDGRPNRRRLLRHDTGPHRGGGPGRPESRRRALMKRNIGAFVAVLAIAVAAVGLGVAAPRGTLTIGIPTDVNTLDPSLSPEVNTENVIFSTMEPLLYLDLQGNVQPRLAESWQVVDNTTYVFKLRKNVKFHNGEPLTGQAVEYSWKRSQEKHRVNRTAFGSVSRIEHIADHPIRLITQRPEPVFLKKMASVSAAIYPPKYTAEQGDEGFA